MRLAGLLIGPMILALLVVMGAARLSSALSEPLSEPPTQASGLVWGGRVFTTRAAFAKWLDERGLSIRAWERRHPGSPWTKEKPTQAASSAETQDVAPRSEQRRNWLLLASGGALALMVGVAGVAALRLRRAVQARPARPTSKNGPKRVNVTVPRPSRAVAAQAVRRGIEAVRPRLDTARAATQRGVEAAGPRLKSTAFATRQGLGTALVEAGALRRELRYAIATGRFRSVFFYLFAALFTVATVLATATRV
jgi:hypothetical protein